MDEKIVLITGGTGSFGKGFVDLLLRQPDVKMVRVFSRDEHKQREMRLKFPSDRISFYLGDVRDRERLESAMDNVDWVVHAAALKQSPLGEIEPGEFIKTNINGSTNVAVAAILAGVEKCILISTDKAVEPINLYGATKMCAERTFQQADTMRGTMRTRFAFTRYGNVVGTAGSVVPFFATLPDSEPTPVTHRDATRFWITLENANKFVLESLRSMTGGEAFIPPMKAVSIMTLAKALRPTSEIKITGLRPGDKVHESISFEPRLSSDMVEQIGPLEILDDCVQWIHREAHAV